MRLYNILSAIFHPSVITFLVFSTVILYLNLGITQLVIVTIFYSIIPFLIVLIMMKLNLVSDIYVSKQEERAIPIILSILSYVSGVFLLRDNYFLFIVTLIYTINTLIILFITFLFKISVHVSVTVGGITLLVYVFGVQAIPLYLFAILISYVRYKMKAHTLLQVISAWAFGPISYLEFYLAFHNLIYART